MPLRQRKRAIGEKGNNRKSSIFILRRKNMKKRMKALAAIALSVCMLAGCGSSQKPAAPGESSSGRRGNHRPLQRRKRAGKGLCRRYGLFRG